ncbi:MAG: CinA family protein [Bacteroidales bacterium]|nr:CinA family protein [Bacteroidales bacterium]MCF0211246.1 CinA family protein [Bacteroidales bacterium]
MHKDLIGKIAETLLGKNATLSTAESCTGGNIAHEITLLSGASSYFKGSVVSYCNEVKHNVLKVPSQILDNQGAVSEETVKYMCKGVLELLNTDYSIAVSGLAGPNGDGTNTEVGTVWLCVMKKDGEFCTKKYCIKTYREDFINKATQIALELLWTFLSK